LVEVGGGGGVVGGGVIISELWQCAAVIPTKDTPIVVRAKLLHLEQNMIFVNSEFSEFSWFCKVESDFWYNCELVNFA